MVSILLSVPEEIILLIIDELVDKKDLRSCAATHRRFCAASQKLRSLYTREFYGWIRDEIWEGVRVKGKVKTVERIRHALKIPVPPTEAEFVFSIKTIIPRIPITLKQHEPRREEYQFTLLHIAAWLGFLDLTRELVKSGADINATVTKESEDLEYVDHTPVFLAAANGQLEVVKFLIEEKAEIGRSIFWMQYLAP
ncbi:hypothetical protein LZ30DRAFT_721537 [Colletotrichum cereale]|nr:hypothetical protein LZ30DRAFT_721537 [Colletotrichum cereale]